MGLFAEDDPPLLLLLTAGKDGDETTPNCGSDETAVAVGYVEVTAEPILFPEPGKASATGTAWEDDEYPVTFP